VPIKVAILDFFFLSFRFFRHLSPELLVELFTAVSRKALMPPSHQTKTVKTALRPENFDERSAVVVVKV